MHLRLRPSTRALPLLGLLVLAAPAAAETTAAPSQGVHVRAVRRAGAVSIDGRLDDAGWTGVTATGDFTQRFPDEGKAPTQRTEFRIVYDDAAIYVGVRAFDDQPDQIRGLLTRRDQESASDWIMVGLDSYHDRRTAFVFGLNPAEVQRDFLIFNDFETDASWDAVWTGASQIDDQGWTVEMRIPLSQLRFSSTASQDWGLQIVRSVARSGEESSWSPWSRAGNRIASDFGTLDHVDGVEPGRRLEVLPYMSGGVGTAQVAEDDPFHDTVEGRFNAGVDVKYGLSSAFTLSATVNPDFGQVEADPSQVNLTAQESFFAEKRPFFLEGTDIFRYTLTQGDGDSGESLFYTRRIGAAPHIHGGGLAAYDDTPENTTIYGAAKISGKTSSGWSIGVLEAVTAEESAGLSDGAGTSTQVVEPLTNHALVRVLKDLRSGRTQIAGILTAVHRDLADPMLEAMLHDQAYTAGLDLNHRFADDEWSVTAKLYGSLVHGSRDAILDDQLDIRHLYQRPDATHLQLDPDRTSLTGAGLLWDLGRWNHRNWNFGGGGDLRSPGVEVNDLGFQNGADRAVQWLWTGYRDNEPSARVLNWSIGGDVWAGGDWEPRLHNLGTSVNANVTLANHWSISGGGNYNRNIWDVRLLRGGPRIRSVDGVNGWFGLGSDGRKKVSINFNGQVNRRDGSDSWGLGGGAAITIQARSNLDITFGPNVFVGTDDAQYVDQLDDPTGETRYLFARIHQVVTGLTVRAAWTFSPTLSLQLYAQPFIAAGAYREYKEARTDGGTYATDYDDRYTVYGTGQVQEVDGVMEIDRDGDGSVDLRVAKPDFNVRELRGNAVVRWEYRPGSTVFLIWSHGRSSAENQGRYRPGYDLGELGGDVGEHVVMLKANFWVGL